MKFLPNTLRLIVLDPPMQFEGAGIEPRIEAKSGLLVGKYQPNGNVRFVIPYDGRKCGPTGPSIKVDGQGRHFVSIEWCSQSSKPIRRLRVPLEDVPYLAWDCEIVVLGRMADGSPAFGTADIISAQNIDDYLVEFLPSD